MTTRDSTTAKPRPESDMVTRGDTDERPPPRATIARGTEVSRYLVLDEIGSGGMGRVFSAHDRELDRRVAIKVLFNGDTTPSSSGANELLREGRALASLRHPNIVSVYDVGWYEGEFFIAMEFVQGQTLGLWQRDRAHGVAAILSCYLEAGAALAAAHDAGVVHGDFKPANVMVEPSGRTVVLDFGLARSVAEPVLPPESQSATRRGVGTPAYMAPEQHRFLPPTPWSDQFSFCVALYEAFVGARPFPSKSLVELTQAVLDGQWQDPGEKMPRWVWRVLQRGLQLEPRDRFPDMHALLRELDPARRRRRLLGLGGGGVALAASVSAGMMLGSPAPCGGADAQLTGVWDEATRERLEARHRETKAWPSVRGRLDAFASTWTNAWRESCEATHVYETQSQALLDRRMACLQTDRVAVEAAVRQLERGGRDMVQRAAELPVFDRDGSRCRTEALGQRLPLPPAGPERERYESLLRVAAEQYATSVMAGDPKGALAELEAIDLGEDAHPDVTGALAHAEAEAWLQLHRPDEAHAAWMRAARAADAAGDEAAFVRIASILAFLDVTERARLDAADVWLDRARSRAQNVELTHGERFTLELRGAVVTRYRGEARAAADALIRLLESEGSYANPDQLGTLHHNLGELLNELGQHARAAEHLRLAVELRTQALGSDHRHVGQSRFMLSRVLIEEGELDLAEQELEAAAAIFAGVEGGAPERVMVEESRAILSAMRGDLPKAEAQMVEVSALARATLSPDDRRHATLWVNHGRMLMMLGRLDEAEAEVRRGLELEARVAGEDHHGLTDGLGLLAEIALGRGRPLEGERLANRAAALASSPEVALDLRLAALMCRAHARCNAEDVRAEANALLDASGTDLATEARRAALHEWDAAIAAYPGCASPAATEAR